MASDGDLTNQTVELLQALIRNQCVNDGTAESGHEVRNADLLATYLEGTGLDLQRYEPTPGRTSLVARIEGSDPDAPALCLMGHTDVVPVSLDGWSRDPFAGELVDGEVWGRGAVDMLNLVASQAVVFRTLADRGFRPRGDLVFFAVADEESGSTHGARWMADHEWDAIAADYVLTENGGLHTGSEDSPAIGVNVAEKGVAWRRLTVRGTPGHGSTPYRSDNALLKGGQILESLFSDLGAGQVDRLATMAGSHDLEGINEMLGGLAGSLRGAVDSAAPYVEPVANACQEYAPKALGAADKVASVVAGAADVMPIYRLLGARLVAEAALARANA